MNANPHVVAVDLATRHASVMSRAAGSFAPSKSSRAASKLAVRCSTAPKHRTLPEIPEVRKFLRELAYEWPYFFYADNLKTGFLIKLIQCMLPNLVIADDPGNSENYVARMNVEEMNEQYRALLMGLVKLVPMDKTMNQKRLDKRIEDVQTALQKELL